MQIKYYLFGNNFGIFSIYKDEIPAFPIFDMVVNN